MTSKRDVNISDSLAMGQFTVVWILVGAVGLTFMPAVQATALPCVVPVMEDLTVQPNFDIDRVSTVHYRYLAFMLLQYTNKRRIISRLIREGDFYDMCFCQFKMFYVPSLALPSYMEYRIILNHEVWKVCGNDNEQWPIAHIQKSKSP